MTKTQLLKHLSEHGGELNPDTTKEMIKYFGENFPVGVKYHNEPSEVITLGELNQLTEGVRMAYMLAEHYDILFTDNGTEIMKFILKNFELKEDDLLIIQ